MGIYIELPKDWAKYEIIVTDFHDSELEAKAIDLDLMRCGECKYWTGYCTNKIWQSPTDDYLPQTYADDFCSYGERRAE